LIALDGGADGLSAYRVLIGKLPVWLKPGGVFAVEIGFDQAASVTRMLREAGLREVIVTQDYNGLDRVVSGLAVGA
jgi:release factor glutamine methyltransferase